MSKVVIVGGGITGLSAAYYLQKEVRERALPVEIVLLEAADRLGGKIETVKRDGYIIERGPDSFLARKPEMIELAEEVGMADKLVANATGSAYIYANGALHPIPVGSIMGIPTNEESFAATNLVSEAGKARAREDLRLPKSPPGQDQSLGAFFRYRLGDEVLENLIEPLLSGVYGGDLDEMSLLSTYPQFYEVEQKYGNLIDGMRQQAAENAKNTPYQGGKQGMFRNFSTGLYSLVEAVEARLTDVTVLKNSAVDELMADGGRYRLMMTDGSVIDEVDSVIITTPHQFMQQILRDYDFMAPFKEVPSTSVVTISMAFPAEAIKQDLDGTGFLVSRNSDFHITACTWITKKWAHSTPAGKVVLRCFLGKPGDEGYSSLSDEELVATALDDLRQVMEIEGQPEFAEISRLDDAMSQYTVGHKARLERAREQLDAKLPGVFIAGMSYGGIGLPDCVRQGREAAIAALEQLF